MFDGCSSSSDFRGAACCGARLRRLTVSAAYWCGTAADIAIVILLLRSYLAPMTSAESLMKGFVWGAGFVAVISWVMPSQYDMRLGDEDYLNANTIGNLCAFGVFFAQYLMRTRKGEAGGLRSSFSHHLGAQSQQDGDRGLA